MCSFPSTSLSGHLREMTSSSANSSGGRGGGGDSEHLDAVKRSDSADPAFHKLSHQWTLWAHLPHNTDWSMKSYIKIYTFGHV